MMIRKEWNQCKNYLNILRDTIIKKTADLISSTYDALIEIKEYDYNITRNEKVKIVTHAKELADSVNKYKSTFEELIQKIKTQNESLLERAKSSIRLSFMSNGDFPTYDDNNNNIPEDDFQNGNEFLKTIESRKKLNDTIDQIGYKITSVSRENSIKNYMKTNNDLFSHKRQESIELCERNLEKQIFQEIQPEGNVNFFYKYFAYILLSVLLVIILIYLSLY